MSLLDPQPDPEELPPDPRTFFHASIDRLVVDPQRQRDHARNGERIARIANEWEWSKSEVFTCNRMDDGKLRVVEGQTRCLALRLRGYTGKVPVAVVGNAIPTAEEAEIALDIATGRKAHTPYDKWQLKVQAGHPHEIAAETVLRQRGLRLGAQASARTIACVTEVDRILKCDRRSPDEGAAALAWVLDVIEMAYDREDAANYSTRFDRRLIRAIAEIVRRNPAEIVDPNRLAERLGRREVGAWISQAMGMAHAFQQSGWNAMGSRIVEAYNLHLRAADRRLSW